MMERTVLDATRRVLEATSRCTGQAFFRSLAATTAEVLGCRYGMVGKIMPGERVQTLALWAGDRFVENIVYELEGTPCSRTVADGVCHIPRDAHRLYPRDEMVSRLGIERYSGLLLRGTSGEAVGIVGAFHDEPGTAPPELATILELFASRAAVELEREETEARLRESEARYRQMVTTCGEGVWTIDARGVTTFANPQMAAMLGYTADEMLGTTMYDHMDDDGRRIAAANMERRSAGIAERHEFRFRRRDGSDLWTSLASTPLCDDRGEFSGALALVTDITEHRALERKLQQTQKLESMGILAGGIAHDFNNLLVGILANSELIVPAHPPGSPMRAALDDIESAARRAADLVRQLLAYAGKSQLELQPIDLGEMISETHQLLGPVISKRASVRLELATPLALVQGDPTQLRQVAMNLLTNASDALGERDGIVTVRTRVIRADRTMLASTYVDEPLPEGPYVELQVSDTGAGMDASTLGRLFDPFFTTKAHGRGLGLASVLGILRAHRGAIRVESVPGHGSTFTVLLPVAEATTDVPSAPGLRAPRPVASATGTILVVDDEPLVAAAARRVLESLGHSAIVAPDGPAALEVFAADPGIRMVLLDLSLPGMSGAAVFRALRAMRPEVPVVLSSGYDRDDAVARVGEGLSGVLQKPWSLDQLIDTVGRALAAEPR